MSLDLSCRAPAPWTPYAGDALLTPTMTLGPAAVPEDEMAALVGYLDALVRTRTAPVHVNVAFNAAYFGFDLDAAQYVGGPLDLDAFPVAEFGQIIDALPVGAMVNIATGAQPLFAEVIYRDGAHPLIRDDGSVPAWLSGAPAGAHDPSLHLPDDTDLQDDAAPLLRAERLVVDVDAFGQGLSTTATRLDRLRQKGRWLDGNGHLRLEARYATAELAALDDAAFYRHYLLTRGREQLLSAAAPMPLAAALTDGAGEQEYAAALAGLFATIAAALAQLDTARLWGGYAFPRAALAARLGDPGVLGGDDLRSLAAGLARTVVPTRPGRFTPSRQVSYTAVGPLLSTTTGLGQELTGVRYVESVVHANTVIADFARREADPDTGLLEHGVHLCLDDSWQGGGIWRSERPGRPAPGADVADPLGLGWREATGTLPQPAAEPEPEPDPPNTAPDPEPEEFDDEAPGQLLSVNDSHISWTQTLRLKHQLAGTLPVPAGVSAHWEDTLTPGQPMRLLAYHDGETLDPSEASQAVTCAREKDRWSVADVAWPLEFFAGIVLTCTWPRGGNLVQVRSTLLDAPVTVDGWEIQHRYDPAAFTRDTAPGATGGVDDRPLPLTQQILGVVRRAGLLEPDGRAVLPVARVAALVCGPQPSPAQRLDVAAATDQLLAAGTLRRLDAGADAAGALRIPAPAGTEPVPVLVYTPKVVVGPPRRPPVPSVLAGLVATDGVDRRFVREHYVAGHLRRITPGNPPGEGRAEAYAQDRARYGLTGPAELPPGYTYVSGHNRGS